jgi:hypothetical protein
MNPMQSGNSTLWSPYANYLGRTRFGAIRNASIDLQRSAIADKRDADWPLRLPSKNRASNERIEIAPDPLEF